MSKCGLFFKSAAPTIAFGAGIGFGVFSTIEACLASVNVDRKKDEYKKRIDKAREAKSVKDLAKAYGTVALDIGTKFLPYVMFQGASIGCLGWSHNEMQNRNQALASAYSAAAGALAALQMRVEEKYGTEEARALSDGLRIKEVASMDEDGNAVVERKLYVVPEDADCPWMFSQWTSSEFGHHAMYNRDFLFFAQQDMNALLKRRGYLFVNEVLARIGLNVQSVTGNVLGWVYDPDDPYRSNCVDFGLFDSFGDSHKFILWEDEHGNPMPIPISLNYDGPIITYCYEHGMLI